MGLKDRINLRKTTQAEPAAQPTAVPQPRDGARAGRVGVFDPLVERLRAQIMERLDFLRVSEMSQEDLRRQIRHVVDILVAETNLELSETTRAQVLESIENEMLGLGPIERFMRDPDISDILVNASRQVYVERAGKLELTDVVFRDDNHVLQIIDRIVSRVGRHVDEASPMVDARLPDGSRVNAIIPPLAIDGPTLSIRRFGVRTFDLEDLLAFHTMSQGMGELLKGAVKARLNILISGGTGSGKTTLLNAASAFVPADERIVTIEDSAELQLLQPHVIRLETRPPNVEGRGTVTQRDLVRNALRMRPDRIILGEVRGDEALDMLQAMNTGHDGSITTVHANSTRDALSRLETLVLYSGFTIPNRAIREQIASALELLVHVSRMSDGSRKVTNISEVVGMEGDVVTTQDIFVFHKSGIGEGGRVVGQHLPTGVSPRFLDRLHVSGIHIKPEIFTTVEELGR